MYACVMMWLVGVGADRRVNDVTTEWLIFRCEQNPDESTRGKVAVAVNRRHSLRMRRQRPPPPPDLLTPLPTATHRQIVSGNWVWTRRRCLEVDFWRLKSHGGEGARHTWRVRAVSLANDVSRLWGWRHYSTPPGLPGLSGEVAWGPAAVSGAAAEMR